jgi:hypothetical protein
MKVFAGFKNLKRYRERLHKNTSIVLIFFAQMLVQLLKSRQVKVTQTV